LPAGEAFFPFQSHLRHKIGVGYTEVSTFAADIAAAAARI
jgi:hypothetical protein